MSHCLFVDVGWFVHFPGIDHVCYASMCFSSLSIHWLVRMAFWVNQYDSLMFYMIVLFFKCFCSFIWFLFCSVVFGYGIYRNQRQAPMPLTLQDVKNTSDPRWFLVCKSTFEIVYTLPEYVFEIRVKWWFWCYVRVCVCVCFVVFVPIFACTKCLPKQSRAFVGMNSALNVAMLSGQEQIWAGTSYLGALRDCLVGSTKSTLPRVAY